MNSIESFLAAKTYAVAGASARTHKYGYKVFKALLAADREAYPLNPITEEIEGHEAYPKIADLPIVSEALSIIVTSVAAISCLGCNSQSVDPPVGTMADRKLGFGVTEGSIGYELAFASAKNAGIQFIELPQQWDEVETAPRFFKVSLIEANSGNFFLIVPIAS